ncbi:anaerobic ribonucleoside-triphosphate reductase activating protein [Candidatus Epulonipiscium fishelsonii]|uniref:Anaerobic ribonucleoside-triphosphate reductase activating protein n=1 Tax=Candidatus Epulonipiscium fishelsonii TaxID=77094 RepID=A0ACC8XBB3_9FIRM|nr:anaerobic ribonucleoside-triphosphate reductase activating protein [Epulopiscium sp. SCG-B05WGA-EpuloA1]ONI39783.1 anaerobic ribonucleoside-triphosphate reductase activating protein [Epulopiscium sp. SCG-B11WGA-EpuloA1]
MKYAQIRKYDTANGVGIRTTLFVSGCTLNCKGCFNGQYKDFEYGEPWTKEIEDNFINHINTQNVQGVSILGGEPMDQDETLVYLLRRIKEETTKDVWVYTGHKFENLVNNFQTLNILKYCDVLVDGPFIEKEKDLRLAFKGSRNQRIINVSKSLEQHKVILLDIEEIGLCSNA